MSEYGDDEDGAREPEDNGAHVFEFKVHQFQVKLYSSPQVKEVIEIESVVKGVKSVMPLERVKGFTVTRKTNLYCILPTHSYEFSVQCADTKGNSCSSKVLWILEDDRVEANDCWQKLVTWAKLVNSDYEMLYEA